MQWNTNRWFQSVCPSNIKTFLHVNLFIYFLLRVAAAPLLLGGNLATGDEGAGAATALMVPSVSPPSSTQRHWITANCCCARSPTISTMKLNKVSSSTNRGKNRLFFCSNNAKVVCDTWGFGFFFFVFNQRMSRKTAKSVAKVSLTQWRKAKQPPLIFGDLDKKMCFTIKKKWQIRMSVQKYWLQCFWSAVSGAKINTLVRTHRQCYFIWILPVCTRR